MVHILVPLSSILDGVFKTIFCTLPFISPNCIPRSAQQINFYQWTDRGRIELNASSYSTIIPMAPTYFIVHGWQENSSVLVYRTIAMNYYQMDPHANIILVDYGVMAQFPYFFAQNIVKAAGTILGLLIERMVEEKLIRVENIQLMGHSLGAHISGMAAYLVLNKTGVKIPRISATDPAGPLFRFPLGIGAFSYSLRKSDTDFLDITHTSYAVGTVEAFGTVDTYVGIGGALQPACIPNRSIYQLVDCDHLMSNWYFAESILSCGFQAQKLHLAPFHSVQNVTWGQHIPLNTTGLYTLKVNAASPYAKSKNTYPSCL